MSHLTLNFEATLPHPNAAVFGGMKMEGAVQRLMGSWPTAQRALECLQAPLLPSLDLSLYLSKLQVLLTKHKRIITPTNRETAPSVQ